MLRCCVPLQSPQKTTEHWNRIKKQTNMSYIPNTQEEQRQMLAHLGLSSIEDLLTLVPDGVRLHRPLNLPAALPEQDLKRLMGAMAAKNKNLDTTISFLGAGTYDR